MAEERKEAEIEQKKKEKAELFRSKMMAAVMKKIEVEVAKHQDKAAHEWADLELSFWPQRLVSTYLS